MTCPYEINMIDINAPLQTERLLLVPLTLSQLQLCLANLPALETKLGLSISRAVMTVRVQRAIQMKIDRMIALDESMHPWQTYWLIIVSAENVGAGLAGFKGVPNECGSTEIGYGIDPAFQNKGYMSEAVKTLVSWALGHPFCKTVTATAVENPASRRLLEKLGAQIVAENETLSNWEFRR